jgi:acyl transferase domain-containing protein/acyl carrier protein
LNEPLAIVGMACRLPGADGLADFWNLVIEGRTAWGKLPESRLPRDLYFHPEKGRVGKSYSEMGAVVSDRPVDPAVCPITPEMMERFDVAHHIFLEVASLACRDAGMDPFAMPADRRTGVYVGHTGGSTRIGDIVYGTGIDEAAALLTEVDAARDLLGPDGADDVAKAVTAVVRSRYPGRQPGKSLDLGAIGAAKIVQEALRLDGPYLVVDAACASSLQAMAIGARALLEGGIDQAIVGGASYCKSDSLVLFSAAQSVSNAGSCPFGADADGLITAEGYVALVIKKLSRAIADGDRIRAVIRGLGVASDGKGKSLWAPRQEGQVLAVERAYPNTTDISRIEYIEAHATSTQVGDATELAALSRLMARHLPPGRQIPIGSVKANIGHTLETAGIASLVKVVLAMEHGLIPPGSTCTEFNAEFDWRGGPFRVPVEPVAWPAHADGSPRCAAVNAFGIGGLNVHVALAEHVSARLPAPAHANDAEAEAIAIVGVGCVLPGALTLAAFHDRLDRGEIAIGPVPPERWQASRALDRFGPRTWHTTADRGGFVRGFAYDWRRHKVPPKQIAAANPLQFMLLAAADAAIADIGGPQAGLDRIRTGVVVGTLFGGDFANQLQIGLRLPETGKILRAALERRGLAAADIERVIAGYEKKVLEKLPALVDETGSFTSSTLASRLTKTFDLMGGALALDAGDCSSVSALSAAVNMLRQRSCDTVICAAGERSMDLMAYEGRSLGGGLAGEPRSVLDGHTSGGDVPGEGAVVLVLKRLADARAAGNTIRGVIRGVSLGSGRAVAEAVRRVVREALDQAAVAPAAVRAVEVAVAAGGDTSGAELAALGGLYAPAGHAPVAGSLNGLIGHAGAAAGAAAIVKLSRSLASGSLPGSAAVHATQTHGLVVSSAAVSIPAVDGAGYRAGCVTVVQDTQVGHVVLDNGLPVPEGARPRAVSRAGDPAVVAAPGHQGAGRPLVAAIFPGQGSQYTDMFRSLVAELPEAQSVLSRLDALAKACGQATLAEIAWRPDNGLGTRIWDTQWGMYLGDLLAWGVLQDMGFAPDFLASHSFGEFPSLAAGGAWSMEDGCRATLARAAAVERHGPRNGALLSVIADRATVRKTIEPFAGQVWVCAENAPEQSVIGGTARVVDAVEVILEVARVKSKRLAVPSPFHTPLLAAAADELAGTIRGLPVAVPRIATFSSTTAAPLTNAAEIRESLIRQMTETVRWVDVVERLYAAGVRTFVEVGPSGVLTGLTRRILEGREGVTFVQFDQRGRAPREHLARLREQLAATGALGGQGAVAPPAASAAKPVSPGRIVSFDATARRRERNRSGGAARPAARPVTAASATAASATAASATAVAEAGGWHASKPAPLAPSNGAQVLEPVVAKATIDRLAPQSADRFLEGVVADLLAEAGVEPPLARAGAGHQGVRAFLDAAGHLFEITPADHATVLAAGSRDALCDVLARSGGKARWLARKQPVTPVADVVPPSGGAGADAAEIEAFLIDFVVEQTGYPREIVELAADLEADLGIDSIRKAQLFGEIGQKYGLTADDSVSLDEFPTLRHLLDYLLPRVGGTRGGTAAMAVAAPSRDPVHAGNGHAAHADNDHATNGRASNGHAAAGRYVQAVASTAPVADGLATELETFLIDFVVEQTGYPREIVELAADLEADLGIDSIRKAQLFGEIGQKYGLTADDSVSLDEFPTLRHLLDYMLPRVAVKRGAAAPNAVQPAARPQVVHSAAFMRGLERGREHAAAIATWARRMVAMGIAADGPALDPAVEEELAGVASAAGVEPAVVRAAFAAPARALGGCDALIVVPAVATEPRAAVVCLGRHADPAIRRFETHGPRGGLVGVKGLPGAVFGWHDAGLVAVAAHGCDGAAMIACEQVLTTCRSIAEAERMIATLTRAPRGLVVAAITGGGFTVTAAGRTEPIAAVVQRADARSPLARVLLADGARAAEAAAADLLRAVPGVRDALAATCGWIAIGAIDGRLSAAAGGPAGADWAPVATDLGQAWVSVAAAQVATAVPTGEPIASRADVTRRYGLVLREAAPLHACRRLRGERVLVVNAGSIAESFIAAIRAAGGTPIAVECGSAEEAIAAVERAEESGAVRHLVVVAPRSDAGDWLAGRARSVIAAFFACQRWLVVRGKAGDIAAATLTGVTSLGGDFGLASPIGSPAGGAISGLFTGLAREFAGLHVRVLDAASTLPAADVAAAAVAEMRDGPGPVETALVDGRRMTVVPREVPPSAAPPLTALARGSVWIVTGGARGVTAECCREMGRRHGLRLALVGSTAPVAVEPAWLTLDDAGFRDLKGRVMLEEKARGEDPRGAWKRIEKSIEIERSLAKFRAAGVDARYYACNLADVAAVRTAVSRIAADLGPVRGIVHGAGFEAACRFEKKTLDGLEATLGPKCAGLEYLLAAVEPATLEAVIGFGSTSGRLGGHGQADYSLANDMLAKIVGGLRQRRPHLRSTVFHWHAWDEVGMASRPESRFVLEQFGLKFMPLAEGVRRFIDEVEAGLPDAEVLVTEPAMCPDAVGGSVSAAVPASGQRGSLVAGVEPRGAATWVAFQLDPTSDRFLLEHKQFGRPLLPAVMGAELIAQAALAAGGGGEIRDFAVERPIGFPVDHPREIRVEVAPATSGRREIRGWAEMLNSEGRAAGEDRVHVSGAVTGGPVEPIAATLDEPPFPYNPMVYQDDGPMWHGPGFRTLTGLFLDRSGGWGRLVAPDADFIAGPRGAEGWTVPIAILDGCIVACAVYSYILCGRRVEVPVRFERLRIVDQPRRGEKCTVRMQFRSQDQRESVYDLVLFGADGRAVLALDGLHLAVMGPERSRPS